MHFYTDDPVRDAANYDAYQEKRRQRHRRGRCFHCRESVYGWEDHYELEGDILLHEDCLLGWAERYRRSV